MYAGFIIAIAIGLSACVTGSALLPGTFILPTSAGEETLKQCSRDVPTGISDFWSPSIPEVNEVDRNVGGYFDTRKSRGIGERPYRNIYRYHRQYIGIIQNGKHLIYGNFYYFDANYPDDYKDEQLKPMVICDGGNDFFGIVYDPEHHAFLDTKFNGPF
jgi:hypothetical protein